MADRTDNAVDSPARTRRPASFEHVFLATDFSIGAAQAIERAARLPPAARAERSVAHVVLDRLPRTARADARQGAKRRLDEARKGLVKSVSALGRRDVVISSHLFEGQAYVEIIRRARSVAADLVVLGRHGRRPVRDMFIGSTAERAIRAGDLPVLVVGRKPNRNYRRPLVAVDLEDTAGSVVALALRAVRPT